MVVVLKFSPVGVILMFSMPEITVSEAAGVVDLTIIKSGANSRDISVLFSTLEGNAVGKILNIIAVISFL